MKRFLLFSILMFSILSFAQEKLKPIARDVSVARTKKINNQVYSLFKIDNNKAKSDKYSEALKKVDMLALDKSQVSILAKIKPDYLELSIPYEGKNIFVQLVKKEIITDEFSVDTDKGNVSYDNKGAFYHGIINGDNSSVVTFSLFEDDVNAFISSQKFGNVILAKSESSNDYLVYNDANLKGSKSAFCGVSDNMVNKEEVVTYKPEMSKVETTNKRVKIYYEIANDIYKKRNSNVANTVNWIMSIQNNVSTLYYNDGIKIILNKVFVWTTIDPYANSTNSQEALYGFRNYRTSFDGDVGQLLNLKSSFGGLAWVNQLCGYYNYSYSGIQDSYKSVPTFSWTVEVITHEFGHNLGSQHTHACVWNGNNTPIDGCADPTGGCAKGPIPEKNKGTIMSYCHLLSNVGINLALGFGDQPAALIRNRVNNAYCLDNVNRRYVKVGGTGDGLSWSTAANLSDVLRWAHDSRNSQQWSAEEPLEIWVAKGYHVPTYQYGGGHVRDRTFAMVKDVRLYGGFNGNESYISQRKPSINETVLNGENVSSHVVVSAGDVGVALLDGFTIWNGKANHDGRTTINGQTIDQRYGGGILMNNSSPIILNTLIKDNYSSNRGGGVYILNDSKPIFQNVVFMQNIASDSNGDGGAIFTDNDKDENGLLTLINCTLINNSANDGGAIRFNRNIKVVFSNNIFYNNTSKNNNGTLNSELSFRTNETDFSNRNSTTINNNIFQYYKKGTASINTNPLLQASSFRLQPNSPAIDKGKNDLYTNPSSYIPKSPIDIEGEVRIIKDLIDLGASEAQCEINIDIAPNTQIDVCHNNTAVYRFLDQIKLTGGLVYYSLDSHTPLNPHDILTNRTYYIQYINQQLCKSPRVPVVINIVNSVMPNSPTFPQVMCQGQFTLSDLVFAPGVKIKWYSSQITNNVLDPTTTKIENGVRYYAVQVVGTCESNRLMVTTNSILARATKPVGNSEQIVAPNKTISDLNVIGSNLTWYGSLSDLEAKTNPLLTTTLLEEKNYYVQANNSFGCVSEPLVVNVVIDEVLEVGDVSTNDVIVYPNPFKDVLHISNKSKITNIKIFSQAGQLVFDKNYKSASAIINTQRFSTGVYTVKITSDNKEVIKKIIKH